ncbi:hypothetical protein EUX98_g107 [Antrodiella citrinella]|uniref:Uncharacterized protein n=1 Tax=Antrodiella citrinella TaxID=2447956 RepID=A0A4S4N4V0_9APHY|nr:hypothetical protein EUX98_g107 [Antrodiella citrinella]
MNPTSEVEIASSTPSVDQGKLQDFCPSPEVTVCATTATLNSRYDLKETTVTLLHSIDIPVSYGTTYLAAGIASSNLVPQGWVQHIHPEGSVYYVNTDLNVVTDASICNVTVFRKIRAALVTVFFSLQNAKALPKDHEIYIHATSDSDICHYYMIDHDNCVEFWLQGHASSELCLPPAVSVSHLKYALQEHYWIHREYFPYRPVPDRLRQELVNVLQHGKGDQMTSFASTFVLSTAQCSEFIQMIDIETSKCNNPQMTHMIARLWTLVSRHRFDHFYGHDYARVSREQRRLVKPARADSVLFKVICSLFFRFPDAKVEELENLLTDHIVYGIHWKPFAAEQLSDWEKSSTKAVALLM